MDPVDGPREPFALLKMLVLCGIALQLHAAIPPSDSGVHPYWRKWSPADRRPKRVKYKKDSPKIPLFNAAEVLGSAYPWRCSWRKRKRNPPHYHLIMKCLRRNKGITARPSRRFRRREARKKYKEKEAQNAVPHHWRNPSDAEIQEDYTRTKSKFLHLSYIQFDAQYGVNLNEFCKTIDPVKQFRLMKELSDPSVLATVSVNKSIKRARSHALKLTRAVNAAISKVDCGVKVDYQSVASAGRQLTVYLTANSNTPMVIDTGASVSITPHASDFISDVRKSPLKSINGLTGESEVVGCGTVEWTVRDIYGVVRKIRTTAHLVPSAQIRLFSPQCYFQQHQAGSLYSDHKKTVLTLADQSQLEFPYQHNNIPMMLDAHAHVAGLGLKK